MLLKFWEINLSNLSWTYRPHMYLRAKWNKKENNFAHRYKENEAYKRLNNDIIQLYWAPCFTWENTEWNSAVVNTRLKHQFQKICSGMDKLSIKIKITLTFLLPPLIFHSSLNACVKPGGTGAATTGCWAETLLCLPLTFLLHGGHLCGDAVLAGVGFNSRAAGGVSGQTRAALTAWGVQVQVITDVGLSVTLFL